MELAKVSIKKISEIDIIFIEALENPSIEKMTLMTQEVIMLREKYNCNFILLDGRKSKSLPPIIDIFAFGKKLSSSSDFVGAKIAIVTRDTIKSEIRFFSSVARNRGLMVKNFMDIKLAESWLLKK
jgi:hypothetical protein